MSEKKALNLQEGDIFPRPTEECIKYNKDTLWTPDFYKDGIFCAGGVKGKDSCQGDSGSAVFIKDMSKDKVIQVGIVSATPTGGQTLNCGDAKFLTYYTRVSHYQKWILDNIQE